MQYRGMHLLRRGAAAPEMTIPEQVPEHPEATHRLTFVLNPYRLATTGGNVTF